MRRRLLKLLTALSLLLCGGWAVAWLAGRLAPVRFQWSKYGHFWHLELRAGETRLTHVDGFPYDSGPKRLPGQTQVAVGLPGFTYIDWDLGMISSWYSPALAVHFSDALDVGFRDVTTDVAGTPAHDSYAQSWSVAVKPLPVAFLFALLPSARVLAASLRRPRAQRGLCPRCRYDLTGNVSGVCPECGEVCRA